MLTELSQARRAMGLPAQSTVPQINQAQFQSSLSFGNGAQCQLLKANQSLSRIDLVVTVSAVTPATGTPAWPEDISNAISNVQVTYGGAPVVNVNGNQIGVYNKSRASISGLSALEQATLVDQTLVQRQAAAAAARTFVIHLPMPWDFNPVPYTKCNDYILVQVQLNALNNILEAGTGACTIVNSYLACSFVNTPQGITPIDEEEMAAINQAGQSGADKLYLDLYQQSFTVPNGSTSFVAQITQMRNLVQKFVFYMVPTADIQTIGAFKPTNYQPITTWQLTINGQLVFSQQPIDADYSRLLLAENGFLNYVNQNIYGIVMGDSPVGNDSTPATSPGSGVLIIGPANTGAPTLTLTFPAVGAEQTLFVLVESWNALRFVPVAGGGATNFMKVFS